MKKNLFKVAALAAMTLVGFSTTAQEETTSGIQLSGSVDAYFRANINSVNERGEAPATSFANGNGFSIGMANLIASKQVGKVGFVADLVFGPRGEAAVFNSFTSSNVVNQLFVTYDVTESTTLTFGNFNTFLGYEVISPTGNFNYSTSYMFSYGPFSHTGLKADFAIDDNWSIAAAVMNATDFTETNGVSIYGNTEAVIGKYTGGLQFGYSNDSGSAFLNFLYGPQSPDGGALFQVDLTTGWDLSEEFYLGVNATYNAVEDSGVNEDGELDSAGFYGVALYPQYAISEAFTLGLRGEFFGNFNAGLVSFDDVGDIDSTPIALDENLEGTVFAATLTGSYTQGALTIKPELRLDSMSEDIVPVFTDLDGEASKSLASFVVGAIYSF